MLTIEQTINHKEAIVSKKNKKKQKVVIPVIIEDETIIDKAKTDDIKTNDFDLIPDKKPPRSTIRRQFKLAENLVRTARTLPFTQFDRLKIAVNLIQHGRDIEFIDLGLEDVEDPENPPSYKTERRKKQNSASTNRLDNSGDDFDLDDWFDEDDFDIDDDPEDEPEEIIEAVEEVVEEPDNEADIFTDTRVKRRIRYRDVKDIVGINNICISNGFVVIDITGKFVASRGNLGSIDVNNIRLALRKILDIGVISYDIELFLTFAQTFLCDVCVDLLFDNKRQALRYINGISSFMPLASNRFVITKFGRHGLQMKSKAKTAGTSLIVYSKGQELSYSLSRSTRATMYTDIIGSEGVELADRTIRFEVKLTNLKKIREVLNVKSLGYSIVGLNDVLNSSAPVMLQYIELFCGNPELLLNRIKWLSDIETNTDKEDNTLIEIFAAERFVEIFAQNNFDLNTTRNHIRTEYINVGDAELEKFNRLANLRVNILNFLAYFKPKSITIMLDIIRRFQAYYNFDTETVE